MHTLNQWNKQLQNLTIEMEGIMNQFGRFVIFGSLQKRLDLIILFACRDFANDERMIEKLVKSYPLLRIPLQQSSQQIFNFC